jgi:hypothetical protein
MRILAGEQVDAVSAALGIDPALLAQWRASFVAAGTTALLPRPQDPRDQAIADLRDTVGQLTDAVERLTRQAAAVPALPAPAKPRRRRAPAKTKTRKKTDD